MLNQYYKMLRFNFGPFSLSSSYHDSRRRFFKLLLLLLHAFMLSAVYRSLLCNHNFISSNLLIYKVLSQAVLILLSRSIECLLKIFPVSCNNQHLKSSRNLREFSGTTKGCVCRVVEQKSWKNSWYKHFRLSTHKHVTLNRNVWGKRITRIVVIQLWNVSQMSLRIFRITAFS